MMSVLQGLTGYETSPDRRFVSEKLPESGLDDCRARAAYISFLLLCAEDSFVVRRERPSR